VISADGAPVSEAEFSGQLYEPWLFLTMLDQLSSNEVGIGLIYAVLDLLARRYMLTDAAVVLRDDQLGTQAFRLGRRSLDGDAVAISATSPGVFCEPDAVPELVRDVVRNVCQLALTVHVTRYGTEHDPLTTLANRRYFDVTMQAAAVQSSRYGWPFALVLVDLTAFGAVNDQVGTVMADELLRLFGRSLRSCLRSGDVAARIGGDNFAIILWNAERAEVSAFVERLRDLLVPNPQLDFTFGAAISPRDSTDAGELSRIAAGRLYEKKGSGPS